MKKITNRDEFFDLQKNLKDNSNKSKVQIKVAMATCSIAAGSAPILELFQNAVKNGQLENAVVIKTGCMSYCHSEPTVEVTLPNTNPIVYGKVNEYRANQIIEKYIQNGELVDGIIPNNYKTIDEI